MKYLFRALFMLIFLASVFVLYPCNSIASDADNQVCEFSMSLDGQPENPGAEGFISCPDAEGTVTTAAMIQNESQAELKNDANGCIIPLSCAERPQNNTADAHIDIISEENPFINDMIIRAEANMNEVKGRMQTNESVIRDRPNGKPVRPPFT